MKTLKRPQLGNANLISTNYKLSLNFLKAGGLAGYIIDKNSKKSDFEGLYLQRKNFVEIAFFMEWKKNPHVLTTFSGKYFFSKQNPYLRLHWITMVSSSPIGNTRSIGGITYFNGKNINSDLDLGLEDKVTFAVVEGIYSN
jgi:hypothetical protein